jgi:hypothetical protein
MPAAAPWARALRAALLAGTVLALAQGAGGGAGRDAGDALSARWFYEQGVALQVADAPSAPDACLRAFRVLGPAPAPAP